MAKSVSAEELQLRRRARRRLIGAITLVTVVAVFLPMILDHEPRQPRQDISIQIPSSESGTFTSKIVPTVPGSPPGKPATKPPAEAAPAKPEPTAQVERKPPAPPAKDVAPAAPAKGVEAKPAASTQPAPAGKSEFVVQVAALNDAAKAKQMQEQIAAAGIRSYTEVVPTTKGSVTRVRAGPFPSREEAEKTRDKLKAIGLSGNLVPK